MHPFNHDLHARPLTRLECTHFNTTNALLCVGHERQPWLVGDTFQRDGCQKMFKMEKKRTSCRRRVLHDKRSLWSPNEDFGRITKDEMRIFDRRFNGRPWKVPRKIRISSFVILPKSSFGDHKLSFQTMRFDLIVGIDFLVFNVGRITCETYPDRIGSAH